MVNGTPNTHITLPITDVADLNLDFPGDRTAYRIPFTIHAVNCSIPGSNSTELQLRFNAPQVTANHNLDNLAGSALNTELRISYDISGFLIHAMLTPTWSSASGQGIILPPGSTSGHNTYYVSYYRPAGVYAAPGTVLSLMEYSVAYP